MAEENQNYSNVKELIAGIIFGYLLLRYGEEQDRKKFILPPPIKGKGKLKDGVNEGADTPIPIPIPIDAQEGYKLYTVNGALGAAANANYIPIRNLIYVIRYYPAYIVGSLIVVIPTVYGTYRMSIFTYKVIKALIDGSLTIIQLQNAFSEFIRDLNEQANNLLPGRASRERGEIAESLRKAQQFKKDFEEKFYKKAEKKPQLPMPKKLYPNVFPGEGNVVLVREPVVIDLDKESAVIDAPTKFTFVRKLKRNRQEKLEELTKKLGQVNLLTEDLQQNPEEISTPISNNNDNPSLIMQPSSEVFLQLLKEKNKGLEQKSGIEDVGELSDDVSIEDVGELSDDVEVEVEVLQEATLLNILPSLNFYANSGNESNNGISNFVRSAYEELNNPEATNYTPQLVNPRTFVLDYRERDIDAFNIGTMINLLEVIEIEYSTVENINRSFNKDEPEKIKLLQNYRKLLSTLASFIGTNANKYQLVNNNTKTEEKLKQLKAYVQALRQSKVIRGTVVNLNEVGNFFEIINARFKISEALNNSNANNVANLKLIVKWFILTISANRSLFKGFK
jgi:hypothetical protein